MSEFSRIRQPVHLRRADARIQVRCEIVPRPSIYARFLIVLVLSVCRNSRSTRRGVPTHSIDLKEFIRDVPDFPKPAILFRDITPLLSHPAAFRAAVGQLGKRFRDERIEAIVAAFGSGARNPRARMSMKGRLGPRLRAAEHSAQLQRRPVRIDSMNCITVSVTASSARPRSRFNVVCVLSGA
jgi:hypothetical protein